MVDWRRSNTWRGQHGQGRRLAGDGAHGITDQATELGARIGQLDIIGGIVGVGGTGDEDGIAHPEIAQGGRSGGGHAEAGRSPGDDRLIGRRGGEARGQQHRQGRHLAGDRPLRIGDQATELFAGIGQLRVIGGVGGIGGTGNEGGVAPPEVAERGRPGGGQAETGGSANGHRLTGGRVGDARGRLGGQRGHQGVDQISPVRSAQAGAQVITWNGIETRGTGRRGIVPSGDVVKQGGVIRLLCERIDRRVEEADGEFVTGGGFLINQRRKTGPQRGRRTGADGLAITAIVVFHRNVVGDHGDIRNVALGGGAVVGGHVDTRLPGGDGIQAANPAATAPVTVAIRRPAAREANPIRRVIPEIPNGFRGVGFAGTAHRQAGSTHHRDIGTVPRHPDRINPRIAVARRLKEGLTLRGHLHENTVICGVGITSPRVAPRGAELIDLGAGRHGIEDVHPVGNGARTFEDDHLGQGGRHGDGHFNIQRHFEFVRNRGAVEAVNQNVLQGHIGQPGL